MANNSAIVINHNHLDWIKRNPRVFVNGLMTRLEHGEVDPFPGHARWNGDGMPGVQLVHTGHSSEATVILVGGNSGKKVGTAYAKGSSQPSEVDALKAMASKLGYSVTKRNNSAANTSVKSLAANKKRQKKNNKHQNR